MLLRVFLLFMVVFWIACSSPDKTNSLYLNALQRGVAANQSILLKMDTVLITKATYRCQKFLIDFSLQYPDTLDKQTGDKLLQLTNTNLALKEGLQYRNNLLNESNKLAQQLNNLQQIIESGKNPELVFNGLCNEFQAVKQLASSVKKINYQTTENIKLVDSLVLYLSTYLK